MDRRRQRRFQLARQAGLHRVVDRIVSGFDWSGDRRPDYEQVMAWLEKAYRLGDKNGMDRAYRRVRLAHRPQAAKQGEQDAMP